MMVSDKSVPLACCLLQHVLHVDVAKPNTSQREPMMTIQWSGHERSLSCVELRSMLACMLSWRVCMRG